MSSDQESVGPQRRDSHAQARPLRGRSPRWLAEVVIGLGGSAAFAAAAVLAVHAVRPDYFHTDDAINEFLPNSRGIWRMISSGQLPVLNSDVLSGGNLLVDFGRGPFHPITLLASTGWALGGASTVALLMAFLILFTTSSGTYLLARAGLALSRERSALAAVTVACAPTMVGIFLTSWWNNGVGVAGYLWAAGALFWVARTPRAGRLVLLATATWALFATGWPPSYIAFALTAILVAVQSYRAAAGSFWTRARTPALAATAVIAGSLLAAPLISEYAALGSQLERVSELHNMYNFLTPTVGQLLAFANPVSGDFLSVFGGYRWIAVPIGFATLVALVAIFFSSAADGRRLLKVDPVFQLLLANTALFYLMTQLPTQIGPTRWSLRYLPYATAFLVVATFYFLTHTERVWSRKRLAWAVGAVTVGALYTSWRVTDQVRDPYHTVALPLAYLLVTATVLWLYRRPGRRRAVEVALVGAGLLLTGLQIPAQGGFFTTPARLPDLTAARELSHLSDGGFVLDAVSGSRLNDWAPRVVSSVYLMADVRLINGYDPVGQAAYTDLLTSSTHGVLTPASLDVLAGPAPAPFESSCWLDAMRVSAVLTDADPTTGRHQRLTDCGFSLHSTRGHVSLFLQSRSGDGTYSVASGPVHVSVDTQIGDRLETAQVSNPGNTPATIAFARMWWPGYQAELDGQPLEVGSLAGVLVTVTVPAGSSGELRLSYQPSSWTKAPILIGLGMLLLLIAVGGSRWSRHPGHRRAPRPAA